MKRTAFTLVEILIVIGIIVVLIGILVPAFAAVRRSSSQTQCSSNIRQVGAALVVYAGANRGSFPPNSGETKRFWYQRGIIGSYLTAPTPLADDTLAGGVLRCPQDLDDALRSYSMNVFASGEVSKAVRKATEAVPAKHGSLFKFGSTEATRLILVVETWCELPQPEDKPIGYASQAIAGFVGSPGKRFGAGGGVVWQDPPGATKGRFDVRASQIDYHRHRGSSRAPIEAPVGAANFAFADGHVELFAPDQLADPVSGKSRYAALWSLADQAIESPAPAPN